MKKQLEELVSKILFTTSSLIVITKLLKTLYSLYMYKCVQCSSVPHVYHTHKHIFFVHTFCVNDFLQKKEIFLI